MANNTNRRRKVNLPLMMALVLFYLTVFSTYLTAGLYAKYVVTGNGGDSARVIKFGQLTLEEESDLEEKSKDKYSKIISPGNKLNMDVTVSFTGSEADTYIFVKVYAPGWTPKNYNINFVDTSGNISCGIDNSKWTYLDSYLEHPSDENETIHVYYYKDPTTGAQHLESNTAITDVPVLRPLDADKEIIISGALSKQDMKQMSGLSLDFTAYAVQAGGFANAKAAWESIN